MAGRMAGWSDSDHKATHIEHGLLAARLSLANVIKTSFNKINSIEVWSKKNHNLRYPLSLVELPN